MYNIDAQYTYISICVDTKEDLEDFLSCVSPSREHQSREISDIRRP